MSKLLPLGWIECFDDSGNLFYFNATTRESQWDLPVQVEENKPTPQVEKTTEEDLPQGWQVFWDNNNKYYFNLLTNESRWDPPPKTQIPTKQEFKKALPIPKKKVLADESQAIPVKKIAITRSNSNSAINNLNTNSSPTEQMPSKDVTFEDILREKQVNEEIISILLKQRVTISNMIELNDQTLEEFGINSWEDRALVLSAISGKNSAREENIVIQKKSNIQAKNVEQSNTQAIPIKKPVLPMRTSSSPVLINKKTNAKNETTRSSLEQAEIVQRKERSESNPEENKREKKDDWSKKEDEFVKQKMGAQQLAAHKEKKAAEEQLQYTINPWSCTANFNVSSYEIVRKQNGKAEFVLWSIEVEYAGYTWTIKRRYSQFVNLCDAFRDIKHLVKGFPPKKESNSQKFDDAWLKTRLALLKVWISSLVNERATIFTTKNAQSEFKKFIAPVQLGDKKGPNFLLPFKIEL